MQWIGGGVGLRAARDVQEGRNVSFQCQESDYDLSKKYELVLLYEQGD